MSQNKKMSHLNDQIKQTKQLLGSLDTLHSKSISQNKRVLNDLEIIYQKYKGDTRISKQMVESINEIKIDNLQLIKSFNNKEDNLRQILKEANQEIIRLEENKAKTSED